MVDAMASYKISNRKKKDNIVRSEKESRAESILNDLLGEEPVTGDKQSAAAEEDATRVIDVIGDGKPGNTEPEESSAAQIDEKVELIYGKTSVTKDDGLAEFLAAGGSLPNAEEDDETDLLLKDAFNDDVDAESVSSKKRREDKNADQPDVNNPASPEEPEADIEPQSVISPAETSEPEESAAETENEPEQEHKPLENAADYTELDDDVVESGAPHIENNTIDHKPSVTDVYTADPDATRAIPEVEVGESTLTRIFSAQDVSLPEQEAADEAITNEDDGSKKSEKKKKDDGFVVEKQVKKMLDDFDEYTSFDENEELSEGYKDKIAKALLSTIVMFLISGILFYLESFSFLKLPRFACFEPGRYGIVLLLVDLQLVFFCFFLSLDSMLNGIKSLFTGKANRSSAAFVSLLAAAISVIAILILDPFGEKYSLYSTVAALFAAFNSIADFLDLKREYLSFRIISNKNKDKYITRELGIESEESTAFADAISEDESLYTVSKTRFVEGFFEKLGQTPQSDSAFKISIPLMFIIAVGYAVLSYTSTKNILSSISSFSLIILASLPLSSAFINSIPYYRGSKKAAKTESTFIGEAAIDEYANAAAVSFPDCEAFPAKGVKVTSVFTYGENRIDKIITFAAKIFETVGGPLSSVFSNSISGIIPQLNDDITILENSGNGICVRIDDKEIYVGGKDYMLSYDFGFIKDPKDENFEKNVGRIMYMAIGDEIAAKMYIRYSMSRSFSKLLGKLIKTGICPAIRTCDPNIDAELVATLMDMEDCPVAVIKTSETPSSVEISDRQSSSIVSGSSVAGILKTLRICDGIRSHISTNTLVKFISMILGVFMIGLLYFLGQTSNLSMLTVLGYQAIWCLPVIIPSLMD